MFCSCRSLVCSLILSRHCRALGIFERDKPTSSEKDRDQDEEDEDEPRVSVFTTVRNKIGPAAPAPVEAPFGRLIYLSSTQSATMRRDPNWDFPGLDLLATSTVKAQAGNISKILRRSKTLKDFGIEVSMGDVHVGPTVAQYSFKPADGVKLNQITARQQDLALHWPPIRFAWKRHPGKAAVGLELPNKVAAIVTLKEVLRQSSIYRLNLSWPCPWGAMLVNR